MPLLRRSYTMQYTMHDIYAAREDLKERKDFYLLRYSAGWNATPFEEGTLTLFRKGLFLAVYQCTENEVWDEVPRYAEPLHY